MNIFDCRIKELQERMIKAGVKAYLIPATDPHLSEESAECYKRMRLYYCAFRGNDGILLVTQDSNYLYTDGRYWTEAESELNGTECQLVYLGKNSVLTPSEFVKENNLYPLALDMRLFSTTDVEDFTSPNGEILDMSFDEERDFSVSEEKIWKVDENLLSKNLNQRLEEIKKNILSHSAQAVLFTSLDDIAYVLGYRGNDIPYTPVFYSYLYYSLIDGLALFIDKKRLPSDFLNSFDSIKIQVFEYDELDDFLKSENANDVKILLDQNKTNAHIVRLIKNRIDSLSPALYYKAIKGDVEIQNTKEIQAIDGIALLKTMKLLREDITDLDEYKVMKIIDSYRLENERCFDLSFSTIVACDENAAMMHYAPSQNSSKKITRDNQLVLIDSGGQYYGGTTDTTRTFLIGKEVSKEVKHDYTLTLKGQIALTTAIFEKGCSGHSLDALCREIFWKEGKDYKCGTGHGVGYMSVVHEGPIGFRYYTRAGVKDDEILLPGHIITIEPGVYIPNKYGIRLENNVVVKEHLENSDGVFYSFETITYCPYDRRGIDKSMLSVDEINWINSYHALCFEKLAPLIEDSSLLAFLKEETKPL